MRETTIDEIRQLTRQARRLLQAKARAVGRSVKVYLHWSAGWYNQPDEDYHINILGDGRLIISTDDFSEVLKHTWQRNTGAIGIALCCCADATSNDIGSAPPTSQQIEQLARVVAVVTEELGLDININNVQTHGEAADNEGDSYHDMGDLYGPKHGCERWDLEFLGTDESPEYNPWATDGSRGGDVIRGKALWYRERGV